MPLPPATVAGDKLHVVAPSEDDTAQVRATSEAKLDTGATVMLTLPLCPLENARELAEDVTVKSGLVPFTVSAIGTRWEAVPFVATTLTAPVCEFPLVVAMVSIELIAVLPVVVTGEGEAVQVTDVNGATSEQVKVMFDPLVPSRLRVKDVEPVDAPVANWMVALVADGVTEKSGRLAMALIKVPTSGVPKPVTRS